MDFIEGIVEAISETVSSIFGCLGIGCLLLIILLVVAAILIF